MSDKTAHDTQAGTHADRAELLLSAWLEAAHMQRSVNGPACLSHDSLIASLRGAASVAEARAMVEHLSSCGHCRGRERGLRGFLGMERRQYVHLPALRAAAAVTGKDLESVILEIQAWLTRLIDPRGATLLSSPDPNAPSADIRLLEAARIDRGRLTLRFSTGETAEPQRLAVALEDNERRLQIGLLPAINGEFCGVVDLSFLTPPDGEVPLSALRLIEIPERSALDLNRPPLLGPISRLLQEELEPVQFWDSLTETVLIARQVWPAALEAEVGEAEGQCLPEIEEALARSKRYVALWRAGNDTEPPHAPLLVNGLMQAIETARATATAGTLPSRPRQAPPIQRVAKVYSEQER